MEYEYIVTVQEKAKQYLKKEMLKIDSSVKIKRFLSDNQILMTSNYDQKELIKLLHTKNEVFIRHLFEIKSKIIGWDIELVLESCFFYFDYELPFSVQVYGDLVKREQKAFEQEIIDKLVQMGAVFEKQSKSQIISVYKKDNEFFIGCNLGYLNLSFYKAGNVYMKKREQFVSRAEFKLLELLDIIELPINTKKALDLGASPGGWTKVLIDKGYYVTAVDPGELDERLKSNKQVTFYKESAQDYVSRKTTEKFDIIVNDMKMDARKSYSIMCLFLNKMSRESLCIMTVKLPKKDWLNVIINIINKIKKENDIVFSRQLYANRSEIMVVFKKRG